MIEGIFKGETINTPSLLAVEDYLDTLEWGRWIGGLDGLRARCDANAAAALTEWSPHAPWVEFLAKNPATRSNTGVCLTLSSASAARTEDAKAALAKTIVGLIETEGAGYDFGAYRDAPPGFRVWCGATVEAADARF